MWSYVDLKHYYKIRATGGQITASLTDSLLLTTPCHMFKVKPGLDWPWEAVPPPAEPVSPSSHPCPSAGHPFHGPVNWLLIWVWSPLRGSARGRRPCPRSGVSDFACSSVQTLSDSASCVHPPGYAPPARLATSSEWRPIYAVLLPRGSPTQGGWCPWVGPQGHWPVFVVTLHVLLYPARYSQPVRWKIKDAISREDFIWD